MVPAAEPLDCDPRLDDRGYHRLPIRRPDHAARWIGTTTTIDDTEAKDCGWIDGTAPEPA